MNELSTQNGRKGISYDWQSLMATAMPHDSVMNNDAAMHNDSMATLRELDFELELAAACSE